MDKLALKVRVESQGQNWDRDGGGGEAKSTNAARNGAVGRFGREFPATADDPEDARSPPGTDIGGT